MLDTFLKKGRAESPRVVSFFNASEHITSIHTAHNTYNISRRFIIFIVVQLLEA